MSYPVIPANAMGQSHSIEAKCYSYFQEIPHIIRGRKFYYHVDDSHPSFPQTLVSIPKQTNNILSFPLYFKINYNTIFPSKPNSSFFSL
jgi:hypothetical protein